NQHEFRGNNKARFILYQPNHQVFHGMPLSEMRERGVDALEEKHVPGQFASSSFIPVSAGMIVAALVL
ncbi:MAG: hypothetical protein KDA84_06145, partial [Planctomycetaceae bacterium]|nr:hypothetical protein [Planctomycetaceae bacterium]